MKRVELNWVNQSLDADRDSQKDDYSFVVSPNCKKNLQPFLQLFSYKYSDLKTDRSGQQQQNSEILTVGARLQTAGFPVVCVETLASGALVKVSGGIWDIHHTCGKTQASKKPLYFPERAQTQHCMWPTANTLLISPA